MAFSLERPVWRFYSTSVFSIAPRRMRSQFLPQGRKREDQRTSREEEKNRKEAPRSDQTDWRRPHRPPSWSSTMAVGGCQLARRSSLRFAPPICIFVTRSAHDPPIAARCGDWEAN
uniref:Uncharacterized protein n=1 Tax=Oryza meridionalis TaxID=40149 RepID=A0A0E0C3C2_9ORYZ